MIPLSSPLAPAFAPPLPLALSIGARPVVALRRQRHATVPLAAPSANPRATRRPRPVPRAWPPMMSAAAAELRRRIQSVQSAEKIVSALRLVAGARIRSTSLAALRARPFAEELQHVLAALVRHITIRRIDLEAAAAAAPVTALGDVHGPLLADPAVQRALLNSLYLTVATPDGSSGTLTHGHRPGVTLLVVVAADRKFCGSYNKELLARAKQRLHRLRKAGEVVELVIVGRIAELHFSRTEQDIPIRWASPMGPLSGVDAVAAALGNELLLNFVTGGVRRIEVVYTRFLSLIATAPSSRTLLPLTPTGVESVGDEMFNLTVTSRAGRVVPTEMKGDPRRSGGDKTAGENARERIERTLCTTSDEQAVELLNSMMPLYVSNQVTRIVREAVASEQASRLAAMTAATDNARDLETTLKTQFNKQRQARITNEIIEVVSNVTV